MINNSQFVRSVLTGNGITLNLQKKFFRIWFMRKVSFSILKSKKKLKRKRKSKISLMALSTNSITETDLFFFSIVTTF